MPDNNHSIDDKRRRLDIALFRFAQIAPVLNGTFDGSDSAYFRKLTENKLDVPHVGPTGFKPNTIKSWLHAYRAGGLEALAPKPRCDLGKSRVITPEIKKRLGELLAEWPKLSASKAREMLVSEGLITTPSPSDSTIRRFINNNGLRVLTPDDSGKERRAWAKPVPNDLWSLDFMHGPPIGKTTPKLLAAIDDASRLVPLGRFLPTETYLDLAPCLLEAFERYGLPKALYCDNGAAFSTRDLTLSCARLGIALIHSKPYDAESRGKIERFFRTVRGRFLAGLDPAALNNIAALNAAFAIWLDGDYHRRKHAGIDNTPLAAFLASAKPRRWVARQQLDLVFYRTTIRKVRKDCTVSIKGQRYEVTPEWAGRRVELRSPLDEPCTYILFADGEPTLELKPLDVVDNDRRNTRARFAHHDQEEGLS